MKRLFLLSTLVALISVTRGIFFQTTSLGGQIQGDRQWQDFDHYGSSNEERYTYQNPGYQQYVEYQPQSYQHTSERLRPTQTLFHATQHLLQPAQQLLQPAQQLLQPTQQLLQSGQQIYHNTQQNIHDPEHAFQLLPNYQLINGFQGSQLAPQNNVPLVVRLVENQALLPIRAVYALPPLLEKLVQRVQGYYSVYNAPEQLTLDRPLFTPTIAPPTSDLFVTSITESTDISDSSTDSSTASPVHHIPSLSSSTEEQKIKPSTETPKQTTTESPQTTTTSTSTTTTSTSPQSSTTSTSNKTPETTKTSKTPTTTTMATSNKVSTLTVLEVRPTTTETEQETANSDTTTEEQTEQTTDPSKYITPDTMSPDVEM